MSPYDYLVRYLLKADAVLAHLEHEIGEAITIAWPYVVAGATWARAKAAQGIVVGRRALGRLETRLIKVYGPVQDSIQGELSKDDAKKVLHKTVLGALAGSVPSYKTLLSDPDIQTVILGPILCGALYGLLAYLHHKGDGTPSTPAPVAEVPSTNDANPV